MNHQPKKLKKRPSRANSAAAQQKTEARRNQRKNIMDETARLFCEKGFADTTMDQIAARVELTKPSLYSYFRGEANFKGKYDRQVKGKREILLTCLDQAVKKCITAIDKFEDDKSPRGEHRLR